MQRRLFIIALCLWATFASAQRVVIIQGTTSLPDTAEKNYAKRMAETIDRALADFSLGHRTIPDEAVTSAALGSASVVILPYNAHLPAEEYAALKAFVQRGGKLIVFYSADTRLAQLMGFKLGAYIATARVGQWSGFRFNASAPPNLPPAVHQTSRNIRPALPSRDDAHTIATWQDDAEKPGEHVAWVASPQGFWMSHVLLADGDAWNKQRLLLGLVAAGAPDLWKPAAEHYLAASAHFRESRDFPASLAAIKTRAPASQSGAMAKALDDASSLRSRAETALAAGDFSDAITLAHDAELARVRAYGFTVPPRQGERVGIWDHSGAGLYLGDWDRTCTLLKNRGITDIFANTLWPGVAHYASDVLPRSDTFRVYGDQMAAALAAGRAHGMRVHAWKVCWRVETAPADLMARFKQEGRLQKTDKGLTIPWLCPSHPANLQYEKDALRELLTRYDVDGVQLDYIRYPDSHSCFCDGCRKRFEESTAQSVAHWPQDVRRAPLQGRFEAWRAGRVTRLVQDLSAFGRKLRPNMEISAAVYGRYPLCLRSVGQDWGTWLEKGWVDFVCPMNYTEDIAKFTAWTREQTALPGGGKRIWPGIGVTAAESRLDAVAVLDQIAVARAAGAGGYVLFDLNHIVADDVLPILAQSAARP